MRSSVRVGPIRRGCGIVGPSGAGLGGGGSTPSVPAEITADPANDTAVEGLTASFSVTAIGTPAPSYRWQVNDGGGWVDATTGTGRTTANYTTAALALADDGNQYRCKVSNGEDDISDPATLTVEAGVPAEITVQPSNQAEYEGATATFLVTAIGNPAPAYQWQVDTGGGFVNVSTGTGGTTNTYETAALTTGEDGYQFRCQVSNVAGNDTSNIVTLTVNAIVPAQITVDPGNANELEGATATFVVTAIGDPAPSYQWQVNTGGGFVNVSTGTGGTTNTYETAALVLGDDGNLYRCQVSNVGGTDTSTTATLTVTAAQQPAASFTSEAQGAEGAMGATFGDPGLVDFTLAGWFYFDALVAADALGLLITAEGQAGRFAGIQVDNVFSNWNMTIGDSNTGVTNDVWGVNSPPTGQWIFMTFRGPAAHPGVFTATWQAEAGGTIYTATRANGMEGSIEIGNIWLNGKGSTDGLHMRAQYVRGYNSRLADGAIDAERTKTDPTGAFFWWVFEDDGIGGLDVRDASGNARVPTLTGGTLTADGPEVGPVP
jgi:predicted hotdog family 3-hydroxylacyl-ACP dehydratase